MLKSVFKIAIAGTILVFASCGSSKDEPSTPANGEHSAQPYKYPDSIQAGLVIATFDDNTNHSHTVFVHNGMDKTAARKIVYYDDGMSAVEYLAPVRTNVFQDMSGSFEYYITDSAVYSLQPSDHAGADTLITSEDIAGGSAYRRSDRK